MHIRSEPDQTSPLLYTFRRCPYAIRARMAIAISGVLVAMQEVALANKPPALLSASAKGTVPILVFADGSVLDESLDIMRWALGLNDPEHWLAGDNAELISVNDGEFKAVLDRYKYPSRYPETSALASRSAGMQMLLILDARLASSAFLTGAHCALCDIAILPFVRQFRGVDAAWFDAQPVPKLHSWLLQLVATPLFEHVMQLKSPDQ